MLFSRGTKFIVPRAGLQQIKYRFATPASSSSSSLFRLNFFSSKVNDSNSTNVSIAKSTATIQWKDGKKSNFGAFWLRDHCKCPECWHPDTKQRLFDTFSVKDDITCKSASIVDGKSLKVTWPDGHQSQYDLQWLRKHAYDPKIIETSSKKEDQFLWNQDLLKNHGYMPEVEYENVMDTDSNPNGLKKWLMNINKYGFSWVNGVPVDPKKTEELARRIAFIRESHYGGFWDFTSNLAHGDTAYTTLAIGAHTDTTYFTDPIGLQLFHLLEHRGEGGKTLLVDGFYLAEQMRQKYPDHYKTLTTMRIPTHSAGDKSVMITPTPHAGYPIIRVDDNTKKVYQIRYNNHDRSALSGQHFTKDDIEKFYKALRVWHGMVKDSQNEVWVKMQPGKAIIVDNWRVFHGRSSFTGHRRLCGAYINWDDYRSRYETIVRDGKLKDDL